MDPVPGVPASSRSSWRVAVARHPAAVRQDGERTIHDSSACARRLRRHRCRAGDPRAGPPSILRARSSDGDRPNERPDRSPLHSQCRRAKSSKFDDTICGASSHPAAAGRSRVVRLIRNCARSARGLLPRDHPRCRGPSADRQCVTPAHYRRGWTHHLDMRSVWRGGWLPPKKGIFFLGLRLDGRR